MAARGTSETGVVPAARVLVVDDEDAITDLVSTALRYTGFDVAVASTGRAAIATAATFRPELIVLDIMLPDLDGFEVTRRLRGDGVRVPVVFLTARDATEDKVTGLTIGGDDDVSGRLQFGDLELDEDTHEVWRAGTSVALTATEFKLLRYLMLNARRVLSKAQILDHVWEYDFGGDANVVETYISYLRKKIDRLEPRMIHTVRGVGYTLRLPG